MPVTINGSAGVTTNSGAVYNGISSGTAVSASGTSIDFTSIPSWVKRITVMFNGVSTSGTSVVQVQVGSGSVSATGYSASASYGTSAGMLLTATTGFILEPTNAAAAAIIRYGSMILTLQNSNTWVQQGNTYNTAGVTSNTAGITPNLSGALDRIRITTVNGTDTFDAGSINILYE